MPDDLAHYIDVYNDADTAARKFNAALDDLLAAVQYAKEEPQSLTATALWPTQQLLHDLYIAMDSKRRMAVSEYQKLPQKQQAHAKKPATIGK